MRPHRWQPTRLPRLWDFPGKNIGVGCHFLLQCMKVKSEGEVAQSCSTLSDPMDCSLPGSSVHGFSRQEYWSGVPLPSLKNYLSDNINLFCKINHNPIITEIKNTLWRRKWQPTPVFLPGNPVDGRAWWATVHGVPKELDMT